MLAFFPLEDDPPPVAFALAVLRTVMVGRGAVPSSGGRTLCDVTRCAAVTAVGTAILFHSKPRPRASARLALGGQRACGSTSCQLCHSVSPWRCHLKGKKAHFSKNQIKIALSDSAYPFPVLRAWSPFADCNHKNKDLGALPSVAGRGRAGARLCYQPNPAELPAVPPS